MRYTFTIEIPDQRGSHENTHVDFLKASCKQMEETLDYATSREGKRLMFKLKEKAGCDETELIVECWEAADEMLGKKSNAVCGKALTGGSTASGKSSPFAKVTKASAKKAPEPEEEIEETPDPPKAKTSAPAKKFPFKKNAVEPEIENNISDIDEEEVDEEVAPAPKPPSKFPTKKFPFKKIPVAQSLDDVEEEGIDEEIVPEQQELLPEEAAIEEEEQPHAPAGPPSQPPSKAPTKLGGGFKRPSKGMTGFAKKSSPFKKRPKL
jgi:hypothetical protein